VNAPVDPRAPAPKGRFLDEEIRFSGRFSRNVARTIRDSFAPFALRTTVYLVVGFFARVFLLATANIAGYWADALCKDGPYCHPVPRLLQGFTSRDFLALLAGSVGLGFVLNIIFRVGISRTGARAVSLLYDEVTMRVSRLPMSFFDKTPVGRIFSRFSSDYQAIFRMAGGPLGEFIGIAFDLVSVLMLMTLASPYYLPIVGVSIVAYFVLYRANITRLRLERRAYAAVRGPSIAHFAETVQGARPIKVFGKVGVFAERFARLVEDFIVKRVRVATMAQLFSLNMAFVTGCMLLVTSAVGLWLVSTRRVTPGSLATAFTFIMIVSTTIQQFFEWLSNLEDALTGVERMDDYLRRSLEPGARLPPAAVFAPQVQRDVAPGREPARPPGERGAAVDLDDLWLRYGPDLPWVLRGLTLHVPAGERLGIVGRTGSGKSSLIQTLFLLYPPQRGSLRIGGVTADLSPAEGARVASPADAVALAAFRRQVALIPQDPTLFRGTLRDNLVEGRVVPDEQIWATLERLGLASWLRTLSQGQGLDAPVDERGANLSAGERQLVCMARCFLSDAPVIVTDEATSAIDPASEALLSKALARRTEGRTCLIVAHRLSTVESCDRVLWLDDGAIRMLGTPAEVLPVFARTESGASP
jgi:ABC-type multidrug transport system fused ATPase/permease subunit